jgi:CubicO group peptidase (beta-lactamase class C family)
LTRAAEAQGRVADGYEPVAEVFADTLAEDAGAGAAFAAVVDGEPVVDLWGGVADGETGAPWREDTIQLVFSGTKGLVAVCLLILIERGALDLDSPVSRYWPQFGKHDVLVRHVASHTAGLPGLRRPLELEDLLDGDRMAHFVAEEEPLWEPGSRVAYHALTFGWICAELVRRIDGRSIGRFFAEEVAAPLGLELWIGLPPELEPRVARLQRADDYGITFLGDEPDPLLEALYGPLLGGFPWNDTAFHRAEIPAANAIGTARSIARLYGSLSNVVGDERLLVGRTELSRGLCAVTQRPYAFGVGFELQTELAALGPPEDAFGHTGSGGSRHGAWPTELVGFSYSMSLLRPEAGDTRASRLLACLHDLVTAAR